jgi:hypothetical protein
MFNRNASAAVTQMQTKRRREVLPERHSTYPHPPIFIFKTLQINSTPEKETGPKTTESPRHCWAKAGFMPNLECVQKRMDFPAW